MNNDADSNQHYITKSFVRERFGNNGLVQKYYVQWNSWKSNASPQFVFSADGYTQLLVKGEPVDNSLEDLFNKVENKLWRLYPVLDAAAETEVTPVSEDNYNTLCEYCAYLWHLSPFAKAKAPADYVMQLNEDLKRGHVKNLQALGMTERDIATMQKLHAEGWKFILSGDNHLQFVFRIQTMRNVLFTALKFRRHVKWTVWNSPIGLPISDIALIDFPEKIDNAGLYILPISPHRVLIGKFEYGMQLSHTNDTVLYGNTLSQDSAERVLDIICRSAIRAVACKKRIDIEASRKRADRNGIAFTKIKNLDAVLSAGEKTFDLARDFRHIPVSPDEFTKYILSFLEPP
ncbi:MAG: hypothetical protein JWQ71_997 [Pedosphaera sp.]|nr:hypothetical protein [Pedosphaera sp.]